MQELLSNGVLKRMQKQWSKHRSIIPMLNDGAGTLPSSPLMLKHNTEVYFPFPHKWSIIVCSERTFGKTSLHRNQSIDLLLKSIYWFLYDTSPHRKLFANFLYYGSSKDTLKKRQYSKTSLYSDQVVFVTMSTSPYNFIYI